MKKFASVAAYLRAVPPAPRAALQKLRKTIKAAAPEATELISYGIPAYKHHGMLVYFAAFKQHCSLFGVGTALMKTHQKALAPYKLSKGTIQFTADKALPTALGRKVDIGAVRLHVLTGPGFSVRNVVIHEDPAFSPEPFAYVQQDSIFLKPGDFKWWLFLDTWVGELRSGSRYTQYVAWYQKWLHKDPPPQRFYDFNKY